MALVVALTGCSGGDGADRSASTTPTTGGEASRPPLVAVPVGDAKVRVEQGTPQPSDDPGPVVGAVAPPAAVARGRTASLTFITRPGSTCQADVQSADGSQSDRLRPEVANETGQVSWSWTVSADAKPGPATAYVACSGGARGQTTVTIS